MVNLPKKLLRKKRKLMKKPRKKLKKRISKPSRETRRRLLNHPLPENQKPTRKLKNL